MGRICIVINLVFISPATSFKHIPVFVKIGSGRLFI